MVEGVKYLKHCNAELRNVLSEMTKIVRRQRETVVAAMKAATQTYRKAAARAPAPLPRKKVDPRGVIRTLREVLAARFGQQVVGAPARSQAVVCVGRESRMVMANAGASELFGYTREELVNLDVKMLFAEGLRAALAAREAYLSDAEFCQTGIELEGRGRRKDGSEFPIAISSSYIRGADGTLTVHILTDLTERRRAKGELRMSQEQLMLAQQAAGVGVWSWELASDQIRCSQEWGPLYGFPPSTQVLSPAQHLARVHPDDRDRIQRERDDSLVSGKPYSIEFRAIWPDGSVHWLLGQGKTLRVREGEPLQVLGVDMDITNRKRAEQERLALSDRLATAQQGERRRISDELHKHLIQQLAGLAIDLGSMLMKPPVSSALLKKRLRSIQSGLVRAAEAARHAAHQLHPSELDDLGVAATLRGYCEDFSRREGIAVEFASRNLPEVSNREISSCLYNVVQECLRNVAQHANAKRASVTLDGADGRIRLRVQDEGIGFPVQSLATTVGLGILRMKERVRLMNGSLTIESQPGGNTQITVEIQLPR